MEIQVNQNTKIEITNPTKVVGEKAYQGNFQLINLVEGVWIKDSEIKQVVIYFDNISYDQFRLSTTKQKYRYFLKNMQIQIDDNYLTPEEKALELVQASKISADLKATLITNINNWLGANS